MSVTVKIIHIFCWTNHTIKVCLWHTCHTYFVIDLHISKQKVCADVFNLILLIVIPVLQQQTLNPKIDKASVTSEKVPSSTLSDSCLPPVSRYTVFYAQLFSHRFLGFVELKLGA